MKSKNLILIGLIGLFLGCKETSQETRDYTILKGNITHSEKGKHLRLYNPESSGNTMIEVNEDGSFLDTLRLKEPTYYNVSYNGVFQLYLSSGMDLTLNFDAKKTRKSVQYRGKGSVANNYVRFKSQRIQDLLGEDYREFLTLKEKKYDKAKHGLVDKLNAYIKENKSKMDTAFVASEKKKTKEFFTSLDAQRKEQLEMNKKLGSGNMSPQFEDYKNYAGGTASLKDYLGSYVYIDVWATWCVPCVMEIPFMKKIEKQYKDKNIQFVGVSLDNPDHEDKWRKMIEDKDLAEGSVQLLADNELNSKFIKNYYIKAIPRFILLDPDGKIISYDAPRPSYPELKDILNDLDM